MKKTIKTGFALLLLLVSTAGFSQENTQPPDPLKKARLQLYEKSKIYNPEAAIATFKALATNGNAEAMNGLGLIYSNGMGVPVDEPLAISWFEKAKENNYPQAYYNLANLYKNGVGVEKNHAKALEYYQKATQLGYDNAWYQWGLMHKKGMGTAQSDSLAYKIFKEGATKGISSCLYAQGYMAYKGLGTTQDYGVAVALFEEAVAKNNTACMYMLGVCYRNGYGVEKNEQKALELLNKAAVMGYKFAQQELEETQPENARANQAKTQSVGIDEATNATTEAPQKLKKIKHQAPKGNITGSYTGTLLRYDFSGQNVISQTPITVNFNQEGNTLAGVWQEQAGDSIVFNATLTDKMIAFSNTKIDRTEHFSYHELVSYQFKDAQLQVLEHENDIYIVGNLQLYNIKAKEPEKPMYLILSRKNEQELNPEAAIVSKLKVYPNPVATPQFNLYFDLAQQTPIHVKIYDFMGQLKHQQQLKTRGIGLQKQTIDFPVTAGHYIINVYYGNHVLKTILIKK